MTVIEREIASQPTTWLHATRSLDDFRDALPPPGARTAVVGCGTSLFMAMAYAALRESKAGGETDAFPASEFPRHRGYPFLLAISRSGTTTEVERVVESTPASVISGVADSPVVKRARASITLEFADEESVVQTRFATTTLALLRAHLGDDIEELSAAADIVLNRDVPVTPDEFDHFVFLGRGWSVGIAHEAALKLREAAGAWTESYPAMEYRHGPISVACKRSLVWCVTPLETALMDAIRATGATIIGGSQDPMVELVSIQRFAVALAGARGMDPDHPVHLARSVILGSET